MPANRLSYRKSLLGVTAVAEAADSYAGRGTPLVVDSGIYLRLYKT